MGDTIAKLRSGKLFFETMVDLDNAMKLRKGGEVSMSDVIRDNAIYTNLGNNNWLLMFNSFGANNIFIYTVEIPMRPFDGSALTDSDGNVVPEFEASDCGRTGDVFFMFQATDRSGLTDSIEDIHIEIIAQ